MPPALRPKTTASTVASVGFGITLAVLLAGGVAGYVNLNRLSENERLVAHTHEVIGELEALSSTLKDAETGQRGYLLTENAKYLQPHDDALQRVDGILTHLKELTSDNPDQQARLAEMATTITSKIDELRRTVALTKAGDRPAALTIVKSDVGQVMMDELRRRIAAMRQEEEGLLVERAAESKSSYLTAVVSGLLTASMGAVLLVIVFYSSQRHLAERHQAAMILAEERERLRVTLASMGDAVIATDMGGRITSLNGVAQTLTGWTLKDAVGQPLDAVFQIVNEQTQNAVENPATRALREGVVVGLANHSVLIARDGTNRPIDDSAAPIRDANGRVIGCVLIFRDVSERRRLEKQVAERLAEARFLAAIVESSEDDIVSKSLDGIIQSWNQAAERLFGYTSAQAVGQHISLIIPPDRAEEEDEIIRRLRSGQRVDHFETVRRRNDGTLIPISLTVSPIRDESGRVVGASKIARDITEQKRAQQALREADRHKDQFLATLAHELRNPLAPVQNSLELLKLAGGNAEAIEQARSVMDRQIGQMVRLIDDLLDVSRISLGKIELRQERVELASVLNHAIESVRSLSESSGHQLTVKPPSQPVFLNGDPTRLAQVISNLLNNACKFTDRGGRIGLSAFREDDHAVIRVRDNGVGLAADQLSRIFEMFTQVDTSLERTRGGLGIGLMLVKSIVELHGGSVEATSEGLGQGAEFIVRLPISAESTTQPPAAPAMSQPRTIASRRILVVDDNLDSATTLAMLLKIMGHETHLAHDGLEAVEAAGTFRPDVVLLDIGLPKLNGYDACRRIREQPWGKSVVLVALTGWGQDEDRRKSDDAGFDGHLVKPVEHSELMKLLADFPPRSS